MLLAAIMSISIPDFEYWFTGSAFIGVFTFFVSTWLAVIGVKLVGAQHYRLGFCGLSIATAALWFNLATTESEKVKPDRDFVYFVPQFSPKGDRLGPGEAGRFRLLSDASGVVRDVRMAINRTSDHTSGRFNNYVYSAHVALFDEGRHYTGISLPYGDYMIDSDPPTKRGKILQRLQVIEKNGEPVVSIEVKRKGTQEVLVPPPERVPGSHKLIAIMSAAAFLVFAGVLGWASDQRRSA